MNIQYDLPVKIPSGSDLGHLIFAVGVVGLGPLGVLESAAADAVDADEEDEDDDVENGELAPVPTDVLEDAGPAGVAVVAELGGGVAPPHAVGVLRAHHLRAPVAACRRRLATP